MADKKFLEGVKQNKADNPVLAAVIPPVFKAKEIAVKYWGFISYSIF